MLHISTLSFCDISKCPGHNVAMTTLKLLATVCINRATLQMKLKLIHMWVYMYLGRKYVHVRCRTSPKPNTVYIWEAKTAVGICIEESIRGWTYFACELLRTLLPLPFCQGLIKFFILLLIIIFEIFSDKFLTFVLSNWKTSSNNIRYASLFPCWFYLTSLWAIALGHEVSCEVSGLMFTSIFFS